MSGRNVPDDWHEHWYRCGICGTRYHASEGHECCPVCLREDADCGCCLECMSEECECEEEPEEGEGEEK